MSTEILLPNHDIITPTQMSENRIILPPGTRVGEHGERLAQIDLTAGGALGTSTLNLLESPTDEVMAEAEFANPRQLNELKYIFKDILSGDPTAAKDERFTYLNFKQIQTALEWIMTNNFDESLQQLLLEKPYLLTFKNKPPTPEEFLTHKYIGSMADSVWLPVRKNFVNYFDPLKPCRNGILNPAIGSGKPCPSQSHAIFCLKVIDIIDDDGTEYHIPANDFVNIKIGDKKLLVYAKELLEIDEKFDWYRKNKLYKYMKRYDVSQFSELNCNAQTYDSLISFFKEIPVDFYKTNKIYTQKHHIIPLSEGGQDNESNLIRLPYKYHMLAHYLRGKEAEESGNKLSMYRNYKAVKFALNEKSIPKTYKEFSSKIDFVVESLEKEKVLEKEHIWATDGVKTIRIFEDELKNYPSFRRGRTFKSPASKKWVNKDGKNYYIENNEVDEYLKNGYTLGMYKTEKMKNANHASYSTKDTKWMNKDGINKAVRIEDIQAYLEDGWKPGHIFSSIESKAKTRHMTDTSGKKFIIKREDVDEKLKAGWTLGWSSL